jgi:hypothetical protein
MKAKRVFLGATAATLFAVFLMPSGINPGENSVTLDPATLAVRVIPVMVSPREVAFTVPRPSAPVEAGSPQQNAGVPSAVTDERKSDLPYRTDKVRLAPGLGPAPQFAVLPRPATPVPDGEDPRSADPDIYTPTNLEPKPTPGTFSPRTRPFAG